MGYLSWLKETFYFEREDLFMLSMQHVMCTILGTDDDDLYYIKNHASKVLFPDAIRAYSGPRQYSHFEMSADGDDVSWWHLPDADDFKKLDKDFVQKHLQQNGHLCENIRPCAIGENTDLSTFYQHNQHLSKDMQLAVTYHLKQDIVFDEFIREKINCNDKYDDVFRFRGEAYDGKGVRGLIGDIEQHGIYVLAHELYQTYGITANQQWFEDTIKPVLERDYPADLADKTFGFMKMDETVDERITNHDWTHLDEGVFSYDEYCAMYQKVIDRMYATDEEHLLERVRMAEALCENIQQPSYDDCEFSF